MKGILTILLTLIYQLSSAQCTLVISETVQNASCYGMANGKVDISVSGGSNNYQYTWSNGVVGTSITNLKAGSYSVVVEDKTTGCTQTKTFVITEPEVLNIATIDLNSIWLSCYNTTDGAFSVNVTGGTLPYLYSMDGINYQTNNTFSNLGAGTYYTTVKDSKGCLVTNNPNSTAPQSIDQSVAIFKAPAQLTVGPIIVNPTTVLASGTDSFTIYLGMYLQQLTLSSGLVQGGTGSMRTYQWSPTTGLSNPTGASTTVAPTTTTTYTLKVADEKGCAAYRSVTINVVKLLSGSSSGTTTGGSNSTNGMINICHNGHTLSIAQAAMPAHLAHGDMLGSCPANLTTVSGKTDVLKLSPNGFDGFTLSPNPTSGKFVITTNYVDNEKLEVLVANLAGVVVQRKTLTGSELSAHSFDLKGRSAGVYIVKIIGAKGPLFVGKVYVK